MQTKAGWPGIPALPVLMWGRGLCCILLPLPPSLIELQNSCAMGTQEVGQEPDLPGKSCSQSLPYKSFTETAEEGQFAQEQESRGPPTHHPITT